MEGNNDCLLFVLLHLQELQCTVASRKQSLTHIMWCLKSLIMCALWNSLFFFFFLQQVNYVVNESYKTVQEVSRNLDGESRFLFHSDRRDAPPALGSPHTCLVCVFISHRASAGS